MCCTWLAGNAGPKNWPSGHHRTICRAISPQLRHVSTIGKKNLLNSNISPTCPHNMMNFGLLMAEIRREFGAPQQISSGFRVLAVLLHGTSSRRQPNFAALNRGRHLYSAGRPSRLALVHILVFVCNLIV